MLMSMSVEFQTQFSKFSIVELRSSETWRRRMKKIRLQNFIGFINYKTLATGLPGMRASSSW